LGSVVTVEAKVSRAFTTSMEIFLDVWTEDRESGIRTKANEAIYTFVAVDETGTPVKVKFKLNGNNRVVQIKIFSPIGKTDYSCVSNCQ
jgi:acyl-CoA hydrolase